MYAIVPLAGELWGHRDSRQLVIVNPIEGSGKKSKRKHLFGLERVKVAFKPDILNNQFLFQSTTLQID